MSSGSNGCWVNAWQGPGSGTASSGSAGNDLSLNWISCLEGEGGGVLGGGDRSTPVRRRATVTIAMVSKILAVLLGSSA